MRRRLRESEKRKSIADLKFGSEKVSKFTNHLMLSGKKNTARSVFYDAMEVIKEGNASAVAIASILHYGSLSKVITDIGKRKEGNIEFLKSGKTFSKMTPTNLADLKNYLAENSVDVRISSTQVYI